MTQHKDFDSARLVGSDTPDTFKLGGETFRVRRRVNPDAIFALTDLDDTTGGVVVARVLDESIERIIVPEDAAKWKRVRAIDDGVNTVSLDDLIELVGWVVEVALGRPTVSPSPSPPMPVATGTTSTEPSSAPEAADSALSTPASS